MSALAAIHVAKKQLGLDEDTYRALLMRETGKNSAAKLTANEQRRVIEVLRNQGFKPSSNASQTGLKGRFAKKLQALWIAAWNLGIVRDRSDRALIAFVKRQAGIDHVRFVHHPEDARKAIEGIKAWMAREAGVNWLIEGFLPDWMQCDGYRIATAQFFIMKKLDPSFAEHRSVQNWIASELQLDARFMQSEDWITVMNSLGVRIREGQTK
ncbi:regulatory protein GemA [Nitratireductor aquimarinus]|uniref:gp16 family protein n=1 Tax=Nitratireductor aquimarinus TaxID=889300 RepID=UPI001A8FF56B|nr:regulatory protein GemA [Nitratireductor aquimarinus]MBN8243286.1 regulatory protein GemA [Nitratireductor aquimarinus]MBY6131187.1 regulatory protein GemA [Nitratireductor aquimarinus]MCA1302057.1 regulatory protein GemA [Nitratireductor aquimarinus]